VKGHAVLSVPGQFHRAPVLLSFLAQTVKDLPVTSSSHSWTGGTIISSLEYPTSRTISDSLGQHTSFVCDCKAGRFIDSTRSIPLSLSLVIFGLSLFRISNFKILV